jgi:catechol 2,3-dioxygenase-like lactoylglutathione lyase family enzyme
MAKLRHIAMQVPDLEKAAAFYEQAFGMRRVAQTESVIGDTVVLSDGVMNLTFLKFPEDQPSMLHGPDWAGLHHFGFVVDDLDETMAKIEANGGRYFMKLPDVPGVDVETKIKDVNGVVVDIAEHDWPQDDHTQDGARRRETE